jgi:hypothetical protein
MLTLTACGEATSHKSGATSHETSCSATLAHRGDTSLKDLTSVAACKHATIWLISQNFLDNPGIDSGFTRNIAANNLIFAYSPPGGHVGAVGIPTADYTSYAGIKAAFTAGSLPGRYRAVIYDNERWPDTPVTEQRNPARYERLVSRLLHRHGLIYIATPTPDLMWSVGRPRDSYVAFLRNHLAGDAARYADIIDIQAQVRETDIPEFVRFVKQAVRQSRKANRNIKILIGLRTNPGTGKLAAAYQAVAGMADGYWLNVNGRSQVAMNLLRRIYHRSAG